MKIAKTIAVTDAQLSSEAIKWYTSSNNTVGYKIGIFKERLLFEGSERNRIKDITAGQNK